MPFYSNNDHYAKTGPGQTAGKALLKKRDAVLLSQTWEDPSHVSDDTGCIGDNDPLDVVEIGTTQVGHALLCVSY